MTHAAGAPGAEDERVEVAFQTGYREIRRVLSAISDQNRWTRGARALAGAAVLAGLVGGAVGILRPAAPTLVLAGAAVLLWFWLMSWITAWTLLHTGSLTAVPQALAFTPDGVEGAAGAATGRTRWEVYTRAVETREFLLLFQGSQCAVYVPWRALPSAEEAARLRLLVHRCVGRPAASGAAELPPAPPEGAVSARFPLRARDVFRAILTMQARTSVGRRTTAVLVVMAALYLWMQRYLLTGGGSPAMRLLALLPLVVLLLAVPAGAWWGARRHVGAMPAGTEILVFGTEEALTAWTPRGSTVVGWESVAAIHRTRSLLVFSLGGIQGIYVPRDALDPAGQQRLLTLGARR